MFGLGHWELLIVGLVCVLLFGNQLPKVARSFGQSLPQFKRGLKEVEKEIAEFETETEKLKG